MFDYFEPVNREENARKVFGTLKQMGKIELNFLMYTQEFMKYLLQVPDVAVNEQLFHCVEGLKWRVKAVADAAEVGGERSKREGKEMV